MFKRSPLFHSINAPSKYDSTETIANVFKLSVSTTDSVVYRFVKMVKYYRITSIQLLTSMFDEAHCCVECKDVQEVSCLHTIVTGESTD